MAVKITKVAKGTYKVNNKKTTVDGDQFYSTVKLEPNEMNCLLDFIEAENKVATGEIGISPKVKSTIK